MPVELFCMQTELQINISPSLWVSPDILLRTPFILSQSPLQFGIYGVVNNCLSDKSLETFFMRSEVNWLPLSLKILAHKPTLENTPSKAPATLSVLILGNL